jgi:hypothetical protein
MDVASPTMTVLPGRMTAAAMGKRSRTSDVIMATPIGHGGIPVGALVRLLAAFLAQRQYPNPSTSLEWVHLVTVPPSRPPWPALPWFP